MSQANPPQKTRILTKDFSTKEEVQVFVNGLLDTFTGNLQLTIQVGEWNSVSCVIPVIEGYNRALQKQREGTSSLKTLE